MVVFVVLHYNTREHTRQCVTSLLAQRGADLHVVIVDNGSDNGSGELLKEEFGGNDRVTLLRQQPNIGYACGINIGYDYAKRHLNPTYVCLSNNDVVYQAIDCVARICEIFERERCDVLGPAIYFPAKNYYQNPRWERMLSLEEVNALIRRYKNRRLRLKLGFQRSIKTILNGIFRHGHTTAIAHARSTKPESQWNAQLHGACVFVGPRFLRERDHAFNPSTTFSCEMDILCLECVKLGLSLFYSDEVEVFHHAHATIRQGGRRQRQEDIRYLDYQIASTLLYRDMLRAELEERPNLFLVENGGAPPHEARGEQEEAAPMDSASAAS